jgi:hypothetical protein
MWWTESIAHGLRGDGWSTGSLWSPQWPVAKASPKPNLAAALVHSGSPWEGENEEGDVAQPGNCLAELGRWRGGGALTAVPQLKTVMA